MTKLDQQALTAAVSFLKASKLARGYAYMVPQTGKVYRVTTEAMVDLGSALTDCRGHESAHGAIGEISYCDGRCLTERQKNRALQTWIEDSLDAGALIAA